jgi:endonuclease-3
LRQRFDPWDGLVDASDETLLGCLETVSYADTKAAQLRDAICMIERRIGALQLDFLSTWPVEDAQSWLRRLPGVDVKVSAAVMNFSTLRMRALVVDCHYFRVAKRLGVLGPKTSLRAAHRVLMNQHIPPEWSADDLGDHHRLMKLHGQNVCFARRPVCWKCTFQDICPTGQKGGPIES